MKDCCHLHVLARSLRIWLGKQDDSDHFTCPECGRAYRKDGWIWNEVDAVEDLKDMIANDARGHLTEEK